MNDERIKLYRVDDSGVFGASAEYDNIDFKIVSVRVDQNTVPTNSWKAVHDGKAVDIYMKVGKGSEVEATIERK